MRHSRPSALLQSSTQRKMRKNLQSIGEGMRRKYGEDPETPAVPAAGEAAEPVPPSGRAVSRPGTPPPASPPKSGGAGVPGTPSSRPGRTMPVDAPGAGTRTWIVELPAGIRLLSLNDRIHWSVKGRITRDLRKAAFAMARNAKVPHLERARVVVEYQPPQVTRRRDIDNVGPASGKPCIDGLVDAKVLSDDSPQYLAEVAYRIGEPFPRGRLVLHVEAVGT